MRRTELIISSLSLLVTTISAALSFPTLDIGLESTIREAEFGLRVLLLVVVETCLAYGFGLLFAQVARSAVIFLSPVAVWLNVILVFVSAWVTLFNVDVFLTRHLENRSFFLAIIGTVAALFGIFLTRLHVMDADQYQDREVSQLCLLHAVAFLLIFPAMLPLHPTQAPPDPTVGGANPSIGEMQRLYRPSDARLDPDSAGTLRFRDTRPV